MGAPVTKRLERAEAVAPMHDRVENEADTRPAGRTATADGSNFANTLLMVSWNERGGTYDHVVPPRVDPPNLTAPTGELGFKFVRAGVRIPDAGRVGLHRRPDRGHRHVPQHIADPDPPRALEPRPATANGTPAPVGRRGSIAGMARTCRDAILEAFGRLERHGRQTFDLAEIVTETLAVDTSFAESTIRTHVSSRMCADAPDNHGTRLRVDRGRYRRR